MHSHFKVIAEENMILFPSLKKELGKSLTIPGLFEQPSLVLSSHIQGNSLKYLTLLHQIKVW